MSDSQTLSGWRSKLDKAISSDSATLAELLAASFPPLATYCPILPQVTRQQGLFLLSQTEEALYGGAVGGGKTAALLMGALQYVDVDGYAALIMRRTFPELEQPEGPIWQSLRWFGQVPTSIRPKYVKADHTWEFKSGAVIRFGHLDSADALLRYQGGGYHYVGFDELTHFEQNQYEFIAFSRQRKPPTGPLSEVPIRVRASANPGGPGHAWVKRRFLDERPDDVAFVPAKVWDNPGIDTDDYVARLKKLNPVLQQQLLDGNWGAFEGAAFTITPDHIVDPGVVAPTWDRFESMDYGLNNPTAWHAWAVDYDGNLVAYDTYYQPGLPSETAPVILKLRQTWGSTVCHGDPASLATRTGSLRKFGAPATIHTEFLDNGVNITPANNNPRAGYARLRELLKLDPERRFPDWHPRRGDHGSPRMFIVERSCPQLAEQLRTAPLQPVEKRYAGEMIDPVWESRYGHAVAAARYGVMSRPDPSEEPGETAEQQRLRPPRDENELRAEYLRDVCRQRDQSARKQGTTVFVTDQSL